MRIALLQTQDQPGSRGPAALDAAARDAAARGARLLVTPELSLTGYALEDPAEVAEPAGGPAAAAVSRIAREHGIALVYGYPEAGEDGAVHNAVRLVWSARTVRHSPTTARRTCTAPTRPSTTPPAHGCPSRPTSTGSGWAC